MALNKRSQMFCCYCGLAFPLTFFIGWGIIAGYMLPLPGPDDSVGSYRDFYSDNTDLIRIGLLITIAAGALQAPFSALIGMHQRRIEGHHSPLAYAQMMLGSVSVLLVVIPMFVFAALAFRPESGIDDEAFRLMQDFGWLMFVGAFSPAVLQCIILGICIIQDKRAKPILPRWVGYYNLWTATLFMPGAIVIMAHSGPFAWNGLLAFWIPATVFGAWFMIMFVVMRNAIKEMAENEAEPLQTA